MPRFAAHLTGQTIKGPARDSALATAVTAGFRGAVLEFPYDPDLATLKRDLDRRHLEVVLITGDGSGLASQPGHETAFRNGLAMAIDCAGLTGCDQVSCRVEPAADGLQEATLIANLGYAGTMLAAAGIQLLVETDIAHFEGLRAVVGNPNFGLMAQERELRDCPDDFRRLLPLVRHIRMAGDRDGTDSAALLADLDSLNYAGWVGYEFPGS